MKTKIHTHWDSELLGYTNVRIQESRQTFVLFKKTVVH